MVFDVLKIFNMNLYALQYMKLDQSLAYITSSTLEEFSRNFSKINLLLFVQEIQIQLLAWLHFI